IVVKLRNLRVVALDQTAARRIPLLCRECEARVFTERINRLYQPLPKTGLADDKCAIMVLEGTCHNFGSACALWIDQHDQRKQIFRIYLLGRVGPTGSSRPSACFDD